MVPAQVAEAGAVRAQARGRIKVAPRGEHLDVPAPVERHADDRVDRLTSGRAVVLAHAEEAALRGDLAVGVAELTGRADGDWLAPLVLTVETLVGGVGEADHAV